jgi:hypothetical protein
MKQKDLALIIIIVFVGGIFSFVVSNRFISSPEHNEKAAKVTPITAEFEEPDSSYFNDKSINPTQLIQIGNGNNESPLKSGD